MASAEHILVVDDEPDIVALVAYHLARAGYRVSTASSGTEALTLARSVVGRILCLGCHDYAPSCISRTYSPICIFVIHEEASVQQSHVFQCAGFYQ